MENAVLQLAWLSIAAQFDLSFLVDHSAVEETPEIVSPTQRGTPKEIERFKGMFPPITSGLLRTEGHSR